MSVKYMNIKEFRSLGLLHEVNRLVLHPVGLALTVSVDDDGNEMLAGVQDHRDAPEGCAFAEPSAEYAAQVQALTEDRKLARMYALGYVVQPVRLADGGVDA